MSTQVSKTVVPFTAERVTLSSTKPAKDVLAALDAEVRNDKDNNVVQMIFSARNKDQLEQGMGNLTDGKRDFMFVSTASSDVWL